MSPKVHYMLGAEQFVKQVLNTEPKCLGLQMESFVLEKFGECKKYKSKAKLLTVVEANRVSGQPIMKLIGQCQSIIQDRLGQY
jgi:hypothetical protein